jgi:hypothetical protein
MVTTKSYEEYMADKDIGDQGVGIEISKDDLNPMLFDIQKSITLWTLRKGRTLIGLNCGLGKGPIQLEFLKQVNLHTGKPVIMFCPPGVKTQFKVVEAPKFGYDVNIVNEEDEIINGINITNYERLTVRVQIEDYERDIYFKYWKDYEPVEVKRVIVYDDTGKEIKKKIKELEDQISNSNPDAFLENLAKEKEIKEDVNSLSEQLSHHIVGTKIEVMRFRFNPNQFAGISLDEASVLKHHDAKTRERLTRYARNIPFRLCATATPAPNDFFELSNYAEFLGIMNGRQIFHPRR